MLLYVFLIQIQAAIVTKHFPDIYLYENETFTDNLLSYFKGTNLSFKIHPQNSSASINFTCSTNLSITQAQFLSFPSPPLISPKLSVTKYPDGFNILSLSNTTLLLFFVSNLDLSVQVLLNQSLSDQIPTGTIEQGVLTPSNILILITRDESVEEYTFRRYDVVYGSIGETSLSLASCGWDFRYFEDILMSSTDCEFVAFGISGQEYQSAGIYVYSFENADCPILVQVIERYYTIPEYLTPLSFPEPTDLSIANGKLYVLNENGILVMFNLTGEKFIEYEFSGFSEFGITESLSVSYTIVNDTLCSVTSENNVVVYDIDLHSKLFYIPSSLKEYLKPSIVYSQVEFQNIYFSTATNTQDSYFEVVNYRLDGVQYLASINMNDFSDSIDLIGPWKVLPGNNFQILVRKDFDGIRVFNLSIPSYNFYVSASENVNLTIIAEDETGEDSSNLSIFVIYDVFDISFISGYYDAEIFFIDGPVYFLNTTQIKVINIFRIVSGWNISYEIGVSFTEFYNYTVEDEEQVVYWKSFNVVEGSVDAGFYGNSLFFIGEEGAVYKDYRIFVADFIARKILPLTILTSDIAILYPDFIMFCFDSSQCHKIFLEISCDLFKTVQNFVICASNDTLQVISQHGLVLEITCEDFNISGSIKDAAFSRENEFLGYGVYILTEAGVYMFQAAQGKIIPLRFNPVSGDKIFYNFNLVAILNSNYITVYNEFLDIILRNFEMLSNYTAVIQFSTVLLVFNEDFYFLYNFAGPLINSLFFSDYIGLFFHQSATGTNILFNCSNELKIFNSTCIPLCGKIATLNFSLIDIENTKQGAYTAIIPLYSTNGQLSFSFPLVFQLYTYGPAVFFDYSNILNSPLSYSYNVQTSIDLKYYINGYSVDTLLLINGEVVNETDSDTVMPASLVSRSTLLNKTDFNETILDFAIIDYTKTVLFLTRKFLVVMNNSKILSSFNVSFNYFNNLSCETIDFIMRKSENASFVCYCKENYQFQKVYYNGEVLYTSQQQSVLLLFTFSLNTFQVLSFSINPISYNLGWLRVLTGSGNLFFLLCVNYNPESQGYIMNNNVYVHPCNWNSENLEINLNESVLVDFYGLNVEYFHASFLDGVFVRNASTPDQYSIYLYAADSLYGIRVINITINNSNSEITLIQSLFFTDDKPVSLTVCGAFLFAFTFETFFIKYIIGENYILNQYVEYPSSPVNEYIGINSVASCSDYYNPIYINLYLKNVKYPGKYILRIMNIHSSFNSSVHKDFTITCEDCSLVRVKSMFIGNNVIAYINKDFRRFETATLGDIQLVFSNMSQREYEKMVKQYGSENFNLTIQANKYLQGLSINSTVFALDRYGPARKGSDDEFDIIIIAVFVIVGITMVLVLISVCVYRRFVNKRNRVSELAKHKFKTIYEISKTKTIELSLRKSRNNF